jgi:signal transduction histidine kinase
MILIVDDNHENIFSLKKLLELNKFMVDTASSGEEALKCILKNNYSLIILDVQMPEMDGFEVAEAVSGYSKSKDIPIIFLSAINTHKKYITKGYDSGGVDYVTKPFDPDILLMKIKTFYRLSEQNRKLVEMDKFLRDEIDFRKQAENLLEQKVEELKSTLESMPQMAFTTCKDGTIEYVNNHWSTYSISTKEFPVTDGISISSCIQTAIQAGKQITQEVKIAMLDGSNYRFHVLYLTPVIKGGSLIKWVGVFTDIHEQKMASQILENKVNERTRELKGINKKLEDSNVELQKFAYVASHDLQEPLRKIQVFSSMAVSKLGDKNPEATGYINKVVSSANRMRMLITDLLDYSLVPEKDLFKISDINTILDQVVLELEPTIQAKNASIRIDPIPQLEVVQGQMGQVFQNILSNALKFSKNSVPAEIRITAERVALKTIDAPPVEFGDFCRIIIQDNGIGFEQIYAEKVFEIFQRLNDRDAYQGTGIGLAIVKKIIERHNGLIIARSKEQEGATFVMVLPIRQNLIIDPIIKN